MMGEGQEFKYSGGENDFIHCVFEPKACKNKCNSKVIQSYYNLLQAQKLYDVSEKNLEMSESQVDLVEQQFELGVVKKTDLLKATVANGQARVDLLNKKVNYENNRRVLFNDMGLQDFGQEIIAVDDEWVPPLMPTKTEILTSLKNNNPSIGVLQNNKLKFEIYRISLLRD